MILKSIEYAKNAGLDDRLFNALDSYRKFVLNPTSHDSYDVPKYKQEIKDCLETLKALRKIKIEPFLKKGELLEFELVTTNGQDTFKFEIRLEDDFRILQVKNEEPVISKGMINYWIKKNGEYLANKKIVESRSDATQHDNKTLKRFLCF